MKLVQPIVMASAMSISSALAINEAMFEGGVLERRGGWTKGDCYKSSGDLTSDGTYTFQSSLHCEEVAGNKQANVLALTEGSTCYYGDSLPPDSDKVDMSKCDTQCQGYTESCGGQGYFLFYTNGQVPVGSSSGNGNSGNSGSSSSSSISVDSDSSSAAPTTTVAPASTPVVVSTLVGGTTIVIAQTPNPANAAATVSVPASSGSDSNSSGGSNKAAVAAGVVVGVVGLAAIAGGAYLFFRSKKQRREAAELHRQNSAAGFASRAEKPPSTYSMSDSRLEPAYMRRMSDGSIADNQDYSRRILKVTNPDDR